MGDNPFQVKKSELGEVVEMKGQDKTEPRATVPLQSRKEGDLEMEPTSPLKRRTGREGAGEKEWGTPLSMLFHCSGQA